MSTHWETLKVDGDDMKAFVGEPDTTGRHPGIVVVMGRTGIDEALQGQVADLAAHGFVSIASDMFHREDPNAPDYDTANMRVLDVCFKSWSAAVPRWRCAMCFCSWAAQSCWR